MVFKFGSSSSEAKVKVSNADGDIASPDYFGHKPKKNKDVVRIGRRPLICAGAGLPVVAGVMTYTMVVKSTAGASVSDDDSKSIEASLNTIPLLEKKPSTGIITADTQQGAVESNKTKESTTLQVPPLQANSAAPRNPYRSVDGGRRKTCARRSRAGGDHTV